ncbi:MAG: cyanoglobin [Deltaproteobacteria bacterium]|nr:cyanoglobin [Deltaproteobacteria bacterium]
MTASQGGRSSACRRGAQEVSEPVPYEPRPGDTPFDRLGRERTLQLVARFYEVMDRDEPALARLHPLDEDGRVAVANRERFGMFLVGWLGGPQEYVAQHGHPRLRMRHSQVKVDVAMRDAWVRCIRRAMDDLGIEPELRVWLDGRFADVADFLRNAPG